VVGLPVVAKATGGPITSGTVNFYLMARDGDNAGKWYRGSDQTWQSSESIAGAATHDADGQWRLSLPSAVWTDGVRYRLYAKESGDLHIPVGEDILAETPVLSQIGATVGETWTTAKLLKVVGAFLAGKWQLKTGETDVYEILDPDDGTTVVLEVTLSQTTPYKTVTVKI